MTPKLILAAFFAASAPSAHAHVMRLPHGSLVASPRPMLPSRAGGAMQMVAFTEIGGDVSTSLEMTAAAEGAQYALFWKREGDSFVAAEQYTSPDWGKILGLVRNDEVTYASKSAGVRVPASGNNPIAEAASTMTKLTDAGTFSSFDRASLAKEFEVSEIQLVPFEDGVLEFGYGKLTQFDIKIKSSGTITDRDIGPYSNKRFARDESERDLFERLLMDNPVDKEGQRVTRRDVYSYDSWLWHRAPGRLIRNFQGTFRSNVLRNVRLEVMTVASLAAAICLYNDDLSLVAETFRGFDLNTIADLLDARPTLQISMLPFTLASPALFLLLVFRTNASYDRWWESRKVWGATINTCRDIARQIVMRCPDREVSRKAVNQIAAFPYVLTAHLRGAGGSSAISQDLKVSNDKFLEETLDRLLGEEDRKYIMSKKHRPMTLLMELSDTVRKTELSTFDRLAMDNANTKMLDYIGMCERTFKSPIPVFYTRHTARFLITWLLFLPLGLYPNLNPHWLVVPVTIALSYFLLGIEELGVQIEEPFSVLPLLNMAEGIEGSITEALNSAEDRYEKPDPYTMDVPKQGAGADDRLVNEAAAYQSFSQPENVVGSVSPTSPNAVNSEEQRWYKGMRI